MYCDYVLLDHTFLIAYRVTILNTGLVTILRRNGLYIVTVRPRVLDRLQVLVICKTYKLCQYVSLSALEFSIYFYKTPYSHRLRLMYQ